MSFRFAAALACYALLALLAVFTLDGVFRVGVCIVCAGFAAKTWIHTKANPRE